VGVAFVADDKGARHVGDPVTGAIGAGIVDDADVGVARHPAYHLFNAASLVESRHDYEKSRCHAGSVLDFTGAEEALNILIFGQGDVVGCVDVHVAVTDVERLDRQTIVDRALDQVRKLAARTP